MWELSWHDSADLISLKAKKKNQIKKRYRCTDEKAILTRYETVVWFKKISRWYFFKTIKYEHIRLTQVNSSHVLH